MIFRALAFLVFATFGALPSAAADLTALAQFEPAASRLEDEGPVIALDG